MARSLPASPALCLQPLLVSGRSPGPSCPGALPTLFPFSGAPSPPPLPGPSRQVTPPPPPAPSSVAGHRAGRGSQNGAFTVIPLQPPTAAAESRRSAHVEGTPGTLGPETVGALFSEHLSDPGRPRGIFTATRVGRSRSLHSTQEETGTRRGPVTFPRRHIRGPAGI